MHPTQHSTHFQKRRPRNLEQVLTQTVSGLQRLAFEQAQKETHSLNIEAPHVALLRTAAAQSAPFRVRIPQPPTGEAA